MMTKICLQLNESSSYFTIAALLQASQKKKTTQ